jgi:hypothetical protein
VANPARLDAADLDRLLTSLPRAFAVGAFAEDRFVAGPAGGFVLRAAGDDVDRDVQQLLQVTNATRIALSDHLPWVPFLDPLLVSPTAGSHHHPDVTVVPVDLLVDVLHDGHQRLDVATMDRIFVLLAEHRLDPAWTMIGWTDERMGPCSSSDPATASTWPSTTSAATVLPSS